MGDFRQFPDRFYRDRLVLELCCGKEDQPNESRRLQGLRIMLAREKKRLILAQLSPLDCTDPNAAVKG